MNQYEQLLARFDAARKAMPFVAVMRGVKPEECNAIGTVLYESGFRLIEVPLNSPEPFKSIAEFRAVLPEDALAGAGTVLNVEDVGKIKTWGGEMVFMPHADVAVIREAKKMGMVCVPGIATPTEALSALAAGANALKIFPAELISPKVVKSMRAILPKDILLLPFGGITPETMKPYIEAGAGAFGLGSALYKPGMSCEEVGERARSFAEAWKRLRQE